MNESEGNKNAKPNGPDFHKLMESMFGAKKETDKSGRPACAANSLFEKKLRDTGMDIFNKFFKKGKVIFTGLDIGTSAVKSAVFSREDKSANLISLDMEEIPSGNFESAARPEIIKESVKKLLSRGAIQGKVFVSFPMPDLLVEFMSLPVMPQEELAKAICWEAKEKLLVDEETSVIDYLCLGETEISQQAQKEILFFSVPRKEIMDNYQLLSSAGIRPQAVRPNFFASFQAFENKSVWRDDEIAGFLDIGAGSSQFSIISGGCIHFNRRLTISGDTITRSIADYCQMTYDEAERAKRELGMSKMSLEEDRKDATVSEHPRVRVSHCIGLHLDQLITEIQYTFNYYSLQVCSSQPAKMSRLIVTGGGASLKGFVDFLKSRLDIPIETPDPFNYVQSKLHAADAARLSEKGPRFSTAIGLAQGE